VDGGPTAALEEAARRLDGRKVELTQLLVGAQAEAALPAAGAWGEFGSLVDVLAGADDPQDARLRLRGCLRAMVDTIPCLVVRRGLWGLCACQVLFRGGARRSYLIVHRPNHLCGAVRWEGQTSVRSFSEAGVKAGLNLTKPDHARRLEKFLEGVELPGAGG
jgi:hypothetical protein